MNLAMRIKELRKSRGLNQKELASRIDVTPQAVCMWESGQRDPNVSQRNKLCKIFGISEAELFGAVIPESAPVQRVPVVSWVHANKFEEIRDPFPVGLSDEYVYTTVKCKNVFALKVENDCMAPEFNEGDTVIVCPGVHVDSGDYIVVADRHNNEATFKQLKIYGNKKILHPLNPKYQDIELDHKKQYNIVGKVVAKEKKY